MITCQDIGTDLKSLAPSRVFGQISRTSAVDSGTVRHQGRVTWEGTAVLYINYDLNRSWDMVIQNTEGHRLFYVKRKGQTKVLTAVVDILSVSEPAVDEVGDITVEVLLGNSGHRSPNWT